MFALLTGVLMKKGENVDKLKFQAFTDKIELLLPFCFCVVS